MSFGFGSSNNNNSTFGGFGGGGNTGGGFGSTNNASTGGSLFGGNTATSGGGFGGFGSTNNASSPFGASNTTTSGGGLFGNNTATSGGFGSSGGAFGSSGGAFGNTANTGGGFGASNNTGGGLFGQNKPATSGFGSTNSGGSLFGNTSGGFGGSATASNPFSTNTANNNTTSGFGASNTGGGGGGFAFGGASSGAATNNNQGTGNTPFQPFSEKDPGPSGANSVYQSITFQQPYQAKSFEELRTEDYAQGRKFGNTNGQAGSFGQSTGFGNFGNTTSSAGGGLFGSNTATSGATGGFGSTGGFGASNTSGGFGASNTNTGGGLFGAQQSKPATPSLFGTANPSANTGGFGASANTNTGSGLFGGGGRGGGFGSNTNTANTGGGLFGANNQQQQNKPAFGGFGSTTNNTSTGGFGGNTNTGGGLFGSSNTNTNTGSGLFGAQNNQQQQQSNPFGGNTNTGGGLFGAQNKPAGSSLFGASNTATNTGGGLFGAQNNQQQQQSNPFGASANTGSSLFGNQNQNQNQNRPPGTGLFGSSTTGNTNTGSGLFGGQNNQQSGGGLFGGNANTGGGSSLFGNQNRPAGNSLFGGAQNTNTNTGGGLSLFGGNQNQQSNTNSLFGSQNNQNQQNNNANSLFGSVNQGQQGTPQNQLHATLTGAPYGNEQLFSSLGAPSPPVGPLATPLSGGRPAPRKTPSLLASARLNTPVYSPRGGSMGRNGGYGFSYSTYGTPGSAFTSGSLTPGASSLLRPTGSLGSALGGRLNKSLSTSNLRGDGTPSDGRSLLRPSAFSPEGTPSFQNGSVRKLKIDRSLRTDLFGSSSRAIEAVKEADAPGLRKRVSFENGGAESTAEPTASNALVRTEEPEEEDSSPALMRTGPNTAKAPETEQVNGQLTTVPEDSEVTRPSTAPGIKAAEKATKKNEPGEYYTKPAMKDLKHMSRAQLKNVGNFIVGREGVGRIEFGSVDLTNTPLEDICGSIVKLSPRSATVYEEDSNKPAMGKALNVPSTIYLENSWPRSHGGKKPVHAKSGREYDKHIARLKRVHGTHFLNYNPDTGVWTFKVDHFTTYGLDDETDDESEFLDYSQMQEESSGLSDPPQTPIGQHDDTLQSMETGTGEVEDTFQFKLDRRSQLSDMPGGFDSEGITYDYDDPSADEGIDEDAHMMSGGLGDVEDDPFLVEGDAIQPVHSSPGIKLASQQRFEDSTIAEAAKDVDEEQDIPGSFEGPKVPRSILKPSTLSKAADTPEKIARESWEDQLQRTMSPKKRDRQALKEMQKSLLNARGEERIESPFKKTMLGHVPVQGGLNESYLAQKSAKKQKLDPVPMGSKTQPGQSQNLANHLDVLNSLFEPGTKGRKIAAAGKGFENPYPKKPRLLSDDMPSDDAKWHDSFKPSFSSNGIFTYAVPGSAPSPTGELETAMQGFVGERYDVRFASFVPATDLQDEDVLMAQKELTQIDTSSGYPAARLIADHFSFSIPANAVVGAESSAALREQRIWTLCSLLFDPLELGCATYSEGIPPGKLDEFEDRIRLDTLKTFWSRVVSSHAQDGMKRARSTEEKALYYLTQNDVASACHYLMEVKDFKLAALVAQLPASERSRALMKDQIDAWCARNDWSEMSDSIRTLYSIVAGELSVVKGKQSTAENRVDELTISKRWQLSWEQTFALRLFYGGHETIEDVMDAYKTDIEAGREPNRPSPPPRKGEKTNNIFFELLSIYRPKKAKVVFEPLIVSGSSVDSRLAWHLGVAMNAKKICTTKHESLDQAAYDFAIELENAGSITNSVWVLLHIHDLTARQNAIWALLERNGGKISTPGDEETDYLSHFQDLSRTYHLPPAQIWTAKALYAKAALHNPLLETKWLLEAHDVEAAHAVLCNTLGPQAVIEQDYEALSHALQLYPRRLPDGWQRGGQVYLDFIRLLNGRAKSRMTQEDENAMKRLKRGLAEMAEDAVGKSQTERVAMIEMEKVLDEVAREHGSGGKDKKMGGMEATGVGLMGNEMLRRYQEAMCA